MFSSFQIRPASLVEYLPPAAALAVVTAVTKVATGWIAAGRTGVQSAGRMRAGTALWRGASSRS